MLTDEVINEALNLRTKKTQRGSGAQKRHRWYFAMNEKVSFFTDSGLIKLGSPHVAQLSILYGKIRSDAPPLVTWLRTRY